MSVSVWPSPVRSQDNALNVSKLTWEPLICLSQLAQTLVGAQTAHGLAQVRCPSFWGPAAHPRPRLALAETGSLLAPATRAAIGATPAAASLPPACPLPRRWALLGRRNLATAGTRRVREWAGSEIEIYRRSRAPVQWKIEIGALREGANSHRLQRPLLRMTEGLHSQSGSHQGPTTLVIGEPKLPPYLVSELASYL